MKIKSCVWYWLAAASGTASLLYGMGIEGGAQLGSSISDSQFVTALCLVLAAVAFLRLGFAAQDREQNARRYGRIDRTHARHRRAGLPAEPEGRMKKRILTLLEVEGLSVLIWLLDARIWLLKRVIRLTEASISLLGKVIDYK